MKLETASILAIGSELLGTVRVDTNSLFLTGELEKLGIRVVRKVCCGDDWEGLLSEIRMALCRAPLLLSTGGLGPTADDLTKEAVAHVFGRRLIRDDAILDRLRKRFSRRGLDMPKVNEKQADVIEGADVLANPAGTAPGYFVKEDGKAVVLLPGVPSEMRAMWNEKVAVLFGGSSSRDAIYRRILKVAGMPESAVEQKIKPVYAAHPHDAITILAHSGEIQLHFSAKGNRESAQKELDLMEGEFRGVLGDEIFGRDEETLEGVVGSLLRSSGLTLALAESCTGGILSGRITDVTGSSDYFLGAAVTYANSAKLEALGVSPETMEKHGAVSEAAAREMAAGARRLFGASVALSVTGIAGPGGGTAEKPVGTVHLALDAADGVVLTKRIQAPGDRALVRRWTTNVALALLRSYLTARTGSPG